VAGPKKLSGLEFRIMEALWTRGECSIRAIQEAFPSKQRPACTTIQTTVYRLEAKNIVRRVQKVGNFHIFAAEVSREAALAEVSIHGQPIVLCHYAPHVWNRSNHGSSDPYGHSHGRLLEAPSALSMDVGVDMHDFRPWHYDEIADIMRKKAETPAAASDH
jgi:hypothetical protein